MRLTFIATALLLFLTGCAGSPGLSGLFLTVVLFAFLATCRPTLGNDPLAPGLVRLLFQWQGPRYGVERCNGTQDYTRSFDLSSVDLAAEGLGFKITGANAGDEFARTIRGVGDINGDGIQDFAVSANRYNSDAGRIYIYSGKRDWSGDLNAADFSTSDGILIEGGASDRIGRYINSVDGAGDVNGDGIDDMVTGTRAGDGENWIIFGDRDRTSFDLGTYSMDHPKFVAMPAGTFYDTGFTAAGPGDVNGDGFNDVAFGGNAQGSTSEGKPVIIYGKASGWSTVTTLDTIGTADGFYVRGEANNVTLSVRGIGTPGDLNQDGFAEMIFGQANPQPSAIVVYGVSGTRSNIDTYGAPISAPDGFKVTGASGTARAFAHGDFNGDGTPDFAINNRTYNGSNGRVTVLFGDAGALTIGAHSASQGFTLEGSGAERAGQSLAMSGDFNGDGIDDLVVGAYFADHSATDSGSVYVIFGGLSGLPATGATLSTYADGVRGFRIDGPAASAYLGRDVDLADVNGDGCTDILLNTFNSANTNDAFVIFGGEPE